MNGSVKSIASRALWVCTLGDLHPLSLRPFSRTHLGFIGDCINVAARLMSHATADEIIVSNSFYQRLSESSRADFCHNEPVEAKNVGRIKAWKSTLSATRPSSRSAGAVS
jgi:hypothetical protein